MGDLTVIPIIIRATLPGEGIILFHGSKRDRTTVRYHLAGVKPELMHIMMLGEVKSAYI